MWYSKNLPLSDSRIIVDRVQPAWYDFLDGSVLTRSLARAHQSERSGRRVPIRQVSAAIGQRVMSLGALCPRAEPSDGVSIELFFYDEHSFTLVCVYVGPHIYTMCVFCGSYISPPPTTCPVYLHKQHLCINHAALAVAVLERNPFSFHISYFQTK